MKEIRGTNNKIIEVNLSKKSVKIYTVVYRERQLFLEQKGWG